MGRRLDNSDRGVMITAESVRRIAKVIQKIENGDRAIPPQRLRTAEDEGEGGGGDPIRIGKTPCDWAVGQCVTITLWEAAGEGCTPTQTSPPETIENVRNLSHDVAMDSWVAIGRAADGNWYLVEAGSPEAESPSPGSPCRKTIGGEDVTKWTGWDGTKVQLLGHDADGCLQWFDVNACETPSE